MVEHSQNSSQNSEPTLSERLLTIPSEALSEQDGAWVVVARTSRVNSTWEILCARNPKSGKDCYNHLLLTPTTRKRGKIYPMKGKPYRGAWEYEFSSGDRVLYVPDIDNRKVEVYYADKHPKKKYPEP